MVSKKILV